MNKIEYSYKQYKVIENEIEYDVNEYSNGSKYWRYKNQWHRINGPAIEFANGTKSWFLNGEHYPTKKEYYRKLLKRKLITKKEAFIELI